MSDNHEKGSFYDSAVAQANTESKQRNVNINRAWAFLYGQEGIFLTHNFLKSIFVLLNFLISHSFSKVLNTSQTVFLLNSKLNVLELHF